MNSRSASYGPLAIRIGIGVVYFVHGIGKLAAVGPAAAGIGGTTGFFASLGIPAPGLFAWVVALVETFGGLAILLGVLTRYAAALVAIDALVATVIYHAPNGFVVTGNGLEFTLVNFFAALALVFLGAGAFSLERALRGEEWVPGQLRAAG